MQYESPGYGASSAIENFLVQQQNQQHQQLMDQIALAQEKRAAQRMTLENQWKLEDRERSSTEKEIAGLVRGDVPSDDLKMRAAKHHIPMSIESQANVPQQFQDPNAAPADTASGATPGAYKGTVAEQRGVRIGGIMRGAGQEEAGRLVEAGMDPTKVGMMMNQRLTSQERQEAQGLIDALQGMDPNSPEYGITAARINALQNKSIGAGFATSNTQVPMLRVDPSTGGVEQIGTMRRGSKVVNVPPPPTSRFIQSDQGLVQVTPSRPGIVRIPPGGGGVGIRMTPPQAPAIGGPGASPAAGPAAGVGMTPPAPAPKSAIGGSGGTAKPITDTEGNRIYGVSGPPLSNEDVEPAAWAAHMGAGKDAMSAFGFGGTRARTLIQKVSREYDKGTRVASPDVLERFARGVNFDALKHVLPQIEKTATFSDVSYQQFKDNMKIVEDAFKDSPNTFLPSVNRVMNSVREGTGSESLAGLDASIYTVVREYAKLATGSFQSVAGLTESGTHEASKLLNSWMAPGQFKGTVDVIKKEAANFNKRYHSVADATRRRMTTGSYDQPEGSTGDNTGAGTARKPNSIDTQLDAILHGKKQ